MLRHQGTIAGIGNAYSDEILHAAKMSPFKPASSLDATTSSTAVRRDPRRCSATRSTRSRGLAASELKGEKKTDLAVHGRTGSRARCAATPSARCRSPTRRLQYCPTCQTGGKPLADRRMSRLLK